MPGSEGGGSIVMLGPSLSAQGGMSAVARDYRDAGIFDRSRVRYVETFVRKGLWQQLRVFPAAWLALVGMLLRGRVRLVHANTAARGSFLRKSVCCGVANLMGVPYVLHIHSGEFTVFARGAGPGLRAWIRWVLRRARTVLVLTPEWVPQIASIEPTARVEVLVNPIAIPRTTLPIRIHASRMLFLGRLRAKKGVFDLVRAMPAIVAAVPSAVVCIAGDEDVSGVRRLAAELGVDHAVETPGWIDGPAKTAALAAADVLVMPSHFEALPICVLEAMAAGLPVVASRVGGIPFALDHGNAGVLVEPSEPQALARELIALLGDESRRRRMAERGRERAATIFSMTRVEADLAQIWQRAVTGSAS